MMETEQPAPRQGDVHCPFCAWNRMESRQNSDPPFARGLAIRELAIHLRLEHANDWRTLKDEAFQ
jgi:hypothetical protein